MTAPLIMAAASTTTKLTALVDDVGKLEVDGMVFPTAWCPEKKVEAIVATLTTKTAAKNMTDGPGVFEGVFTGYALAEARQWHKLAAAEPKAGRFDPLTGKVYALDVDELFEPYTCTDTADTSLIVWPPENETSHMALLLRMTAPYGAVGYQFGSGRDPHIFDGNKTGLFDPSTVTALLQSDNASLALTELFLQKLAPGIIEGNDSYEDDAAVAALLTQLKSKSGHVVLVAREALDGDACPSTLKNPFVAGRKVSHADNVGAMAKFDPSTVLELLEGRSVDGPNRAHAAEALTGNHHRRQLS
jgi:hypothetical protein